MFEFDSSKSEANKLKHGIDFVEAQSLWGDPHLLEIPSKAVDDEPRSMVVGVMGNKHWSGVITYRGDSIRIISVRRARKSEVELYEG